MTGSFDEDHPDAEWSGRPQDDPRYIAATKAARQAYRTAHPPVNCWIDSVQEIDLYLDAKHRARVLTDKAIAYLFDEGGNTSGSLIYLRSETPFDAVEKHLDIDRVLEVRDDSNEGGGEVCPFTRELSEQSARAFRSECPIGGEAERYLRDAIHTYEFFGGTVMPTGRQWRAIIDTALAALAQGDRTTARSAIVNALTGMNKDMILNWQMAWVDCSRAAEVLRRELAAEAART